MKKALRNLMIGAACCTMIFPASLMSACGHKFDTENRAVGLALGAVDENFNPFFYTAQNDGEVVSLTQIGLITSDEKGNPTCGQNEPTVALAYKDTTYNKAGNVVEEGNAESTTVYEFVIKNGVKFSDGHDLTIKDVLFNLYVYLDPLYAGSSTIYSTKIKGLAAYRSQQPGMSDNDGNSYEDQFSGEANTRFNNLVLYDRANTSITLTPQMQADMLTVADEFKKELNTDWNNNAGTVNSYNKDYRFTEDWEVFYFNEGLIGYQYETNTATNSKVRKKDADGKYLTTLDEGGDKTNLRKAMNDALSGLTGEAREKKMREEAIDTLFEEYLDDRGEGNNRVVTPSSTGKMATILTEWATGSSVRQEFLAQAMSTYYESITASGGLAVKSISGITTYKTTKNEFTGAKGGSELESNQTYDVLRIEINGVDPAAIWQFGFTVAPMHYYSGTVNGVNYVDIANNTEPNNETVSNRFGVAFANKTFFDSVLNSAEKTRLPVGAGSYKAKDGNDRIYLNNVAQYERNTYFETVGSQLSNAKIKYLNYQKTSDDMLLNTLKTGGLDYGAPNCTPDNIRELTGAKDLTQIQYDANGFGYVGINPKFVPDINVRRAIMKAMNINMITSQYYTSSYSKVIYRPISLTSWVYTDSSDSQKHQYFSEYSNIKYSADNVKEITDLVEGAGWEKKDGIYTKNGKTLKLTFTIAGETIDHPAYDMFVDAANLLNSVGFDITVQNNIQALQMLATGKLAVWAAAWTSGIDPDMYQVYHKDSKATSVKNWGYDVILQNTTGEYEDELTIVNDLSVLIEQGRAVTNRESRRAIYCDALNKVMELAVELPTYQRKDLVVFNSTIINGNSLNRSANANAGVLNRIWELDYN